MFKLENLNVKKIKDVAKKTVAIGAATVVFGGAGGLGVKEVQAGTAGEDKGKISSIENTKSKENVKRVDLEKKLLEQYQKKEKENLQEHASKIAEKIRQEQIEHYSSKEYLDRLVVEYGGNEKRAKEVQSERVANLKTVEIDTSLSYAEFADKIKSTKTNVDGTKNLFLLGVYDDKVRVPYDINERIMEAKILISKLNIINGIEITDQMRKILKDELGVSLENILRHEITHVATGKYGEMSNNAIEIFKKSYVPSGNGIDKYFMHPLELLERKKAMDREMERLGIKKYGEEFIPEKHYKQVIDAYEKGLFSEDAKDAKEFMLIIKKDPNLYKEIFNNIAKNESVESQNIQQA